MTPPCTANPRLWETHRLVEFNYVKAPRRELQAAIDACTACPLLAACREWQPAADMVQAGIIHNGVGEPVTLAQFCGLNVPGTACQELTGTLEGANRHRRVGESPCEPCRKESRQSKAGRRLTRCRRGHRYTTATTGRDSLGRRVCFVCRPDRIPSGSVRDTCVKAGHDWTNPRNVEIHGDGRRRCAECRRIKQRRFNADRKAA